MPNCYDNYEYHYYDILGFRWYFQQSHLCFQLVSIGIIYALGYLS